ncbi:hypothetical protein GE09DRAFT_1210940 [Coniochaeta sp. 2T2.1]|nr:hypothetical protein GE09DRAFT_1210940 [Coniochaeta sp. 2T2.1]
MPKLKTIAGLRHVGLRQAKENHRPSQRPLVKIHSLLIFPVLAFFLLADLSSADSGVKCDPLISVCPLLTVLGLSSGSPSSTSVIGVLQSAVTHNTKPNSTQYLDHDRIFCFGSDKTDVPFVGTVNIGGFTGVGICVFPEGGELNLARAKELMDVLVRSNCNACGSVPTGYPNTSGGPVLKVDFMKNASCFRTCIAAGDLVEPTPTDNGSAVATVTVTSEWPGWRNGGAGGKDRGVRLSLEGGLTSLLGSMTVFGGLLVALSV